MQLNQDPEWEVLSEVSSESGRHYGTWNYYVRAHLKYCLYKTIAKSILVIFRCNRFFLTR